MARSLSISNIPNYASFIDQVRRTFLRCESLQMNIADGDHSLRQEGHRSAPGSCERYGACRRRWTSKVSGPVYDESGTREMHRHVSDERGVSADRDFIDRQCS